MAGTEAVAAPPVKVVAFSGSARTGSFTRKALDVSLDAVTRAGAEVTLVDLGEWRLPPFDNSPEVEKENPTVQRLRACVRSADALLLATPVYHDSYSGLLKNALDLLYYDELSEKIAALMAVGGGKVGHGQALEHLRAVLRETGTWVLPRQVVIGTADQAFDTSGQLNDKELVTRLTLLGQELVMRARLMRRRRA